jgi:hypothetical protein
MGLCPHKVRKGQKEERILDETKTYGLYFPLRDKLCVLVFLGLMILAGLIFLFWGIFTVDPDGPPWFAGLFWLVMAGWAWWYYVFSIPYRISVAETGEITFSSLLRRNRITAADIKSIKPKGGQIGFLVVRTSHGKIRVINQFDGFHEFIADLKAANPSIEIRGC